MLLPKLVRIATAKTRAEPKPAAGGHVYHVYPRDWKGPKEADSFNYLMCAYNYYCGGGDTVTGGRPRVKPGDIILVHAGVYRYHPEYYTGDRSINSTTPVEGTYYLFANGTPEDWHREVARFIAALDGDPELKGKIGYRVMKNRDDSSYYHIASVVDDAAVKTLQSREFFKA